MKNKIILILSMIIGSLMLFSCGDEGEDNADMAYEAAMQGLSAEEVLEYAEPALEDLGGMDLESVCKLTIAYDYLYEKSLGKRYAEEFASCYETAMESGETEANDCFNELAGSDYTDKKLKITYKSLNLVKNVHERIDDAADELIDMALEHIQ